MYMYLKYDQLTNDTDKDRKLLLLAENYYIDKDNLYKISLPRGRREKRLRPTLYQLCVPKCYREQLLSQYHNFLDHFSFSDYIQLCLSATFGKLYATA